MRRKLRFLKSLRFRLIIIMTLLGFLPCCIATIALLLIFRESTEAYMGVWHDSMIILATFGIVLFSCAVFLAIVLVKPFHRIIVAMEEITEGHQDDYLKEHAYTETEDMSEAFNRQLRQLKLLNESREEFVSNVSHELKTPLTSMKVMADSLLAQEQVSPQLYREFMEDIAGQVERENAVINDLLTLVKMDKTKVSLNIKANDMNQLVERVLKQLRPIAAVSNIELIFESFRAVSAEVDEVKLSLALMNLVENAIKYNQKDGWVRVSLNADYQNFYVMVEDSGRGISGEEQELIFERFYRVDKSHSEEISGTGLGLAITKEAVALHRGTIEIYSEEGRGTTFTVKIPLSYIA